MWWICDWASECASERGANDDANTIDYPHTPYGCSNEWMRCDAMRWYKIITDRFVRPKSDEWSVVFHFRKSRDTRRSPPCRTHTGTYSFRGCQKQIVAPKHTHHSCSRSIRSFFPSIFRHFSVATFFPSNFQRDLLPQRKKRHKNASTTSDNKSTQWTCAYASVMEYAKNELGLFSRAK